VTCSYCPFERAPQIFLSDDDSGGAVMALFFCEHCKKETMFLSIHSTIRVVEVSRSTVYYWMEHGWVHWLELPSGRRVICQESLSHGARQRKSDLDSSA
jgi:hypothetical protein